MEQRRETHLRSNVLGWRSRIIQWFRVVCSQRETDLRLRGTTTSDRQTSERCCYEGCASCENLGSSVVLLCHGIASILRCWRCTCAHASRRLASLAKNTSSTCCHTRGSGNSLVPRTLSEAVAVHSAMRCGLRDWDRLTKRDQEAVPQRKNLCNVACSEACGAEARE